jgi:Flp pilus assembly protein TadD
LLEQGHFAEAETLFTEALRINPRDIDAMSGLAQVQISQGETADAIALLKTAIQVSPNSPDALSALAWVLATDPVPEYRNGTQAVVLGQRACQGNGGNEVRCWAALDAAYAEAGRFTDAIRAGEKTRALALASGQTNLANEAEARLALYAKRQPFHR